MSNFNLFFLKSSNLFCSWLLIFILFVFIMMFFFMLTVFLSMLYVLMYNGLVFYFGHSKHMA